jgi:hypothetical protein
VVSRLKLGDFKVESGDFKPRGIKMVRLKTRFRSGRNAAVLSSHCANGLRSLSAGVALWFSNVPFLFRWGVMKRRGWRLYENADSAFGGVYY